MQKIVMLSVFLLIGKTSLFATTWLVGPSRTYTAPSQVSNLVQDGDTVLIDSATYNSDVTQWNANNLLLKGTGGGYAHLQANGHNYGGKAIWVINGNNTTVDSIEFSLCACVDHNGAGIRQQGTNLTVKHCYFHDNEDGILTTADTTSDILIEYTQFYNNGYGDGYSHNLYIGQVRSLTFQYNYSHHASVGHELKSRAINNYILYNRFADEATGTASKDIDLPNGGVAIIIGNEIEKGPQAQNSNFMEFGLEGLVNPGPQQLYVVNNTFVNDKPNGSFVQAQTGVSLCKAYNNIFAGAGTAIIADSASIDTSNNFYTSVANAGLVDAANYDYHLLSTSAAINNGTMPGSANSFSLTPAYEYVGLVNESSRFVNNAIDIGAHEYGSPASSVAQVNNEYAVLVYPNPAKGAFTINISALGLGQAKVQLFNALGELIVEKEQVNTLDKVFFDNFNLAGGVYIIRVVGSTRSATKILFIQN